MSATFWALLFNGFVGFQFIEDGSPLSIWVRLLGFTLLDSKPFKLTKTGKQSLRISSGLIFAATYTIAIGTFLGLLGLSRQAPMPFFILYFCFNGFCALLYVGLQVALVLNTLEDRWPLGEPLLLLVNLQHGTHSRHKNDSRPGLWILLLCPWTGRRVHFLGSHL
jgi:hypothetical protein